MSFDTEEGKKEEKKLLQICRSNLLGLGADNKVFVQVAEGYTPQEKKAVLFRFLNLFQMKTLPQDLLVVAMQMLILPMLTHAFQNNQSWDVVDSAIIKTIVEKLLDPPEEVLFIGIQEAVIVCPCPFDARSFSLAFISRTTRKHL